MPTQYFSHRRIFYSRLQKYPPLFLRCQLLPALACFYGFFRLSYLFCSHCLFLLSVSYSTPEKLSTQLLPLSLCHYRRFSAITLTQKQRVLNINLFPCFEIPLKTY